MVLLKWVYDNHKLTGWSGHVAPLFSDIFYAKNGFSNVFYGGITNMGGHTECLSHRAWPVDGLDS